MSDTLREFRVFGPPGTGKTTFLVSEIARLARREGPQSIAIASFTNTGAIEIAGRVDLELNAYGVTIPRSQCKTVHGLAYSTSESRVEIAEVAPLVDTWNRQWLDVGPEWLIDAKGAADLSTVMTGSGKFMGHYSRIRNLLLDSRDEDRIWAESEELREWAREWEEFKQEHGAIDFTDMIEQAGSLPDHIRYLIVDEAQDLTPLEAQLVRRWGSEASMLVLAGDDDQAIYSFRGGTAGIMLDPPIEEKMQKILSRSYRLPSVIKDYTEDYIVDRVTRRKVKEFQPHEEGGCVEGLEFGWDQGDLLADFVEGELERDTEGQVMLLASCSYMLGPVAKALRKRGILYHNPYKAGRGGWNTAKNPVLKALRALLRGLEGYSPEPRWTMEDFATFVAPLDWKRLPRAETKKSIKDAGTSKSERNLIVGKGDIAAILGIDQEIIGPKWFFDSILMSWKPAFAKACLERHGMNTLMEPPRTIIGTIHSVKGGQAETVIVSPDISYASAQDPHPEAAENLARMFYVAMTRARKQLFLLEPCGKYWARLPEPEEVGKRSDETKPLPF